MRRASMTDALVQFCLRNIILTALLPTTFNLFFKFRKSKLLAEAPWELDIERDQALVLLSKRASIARQGTIHAAALLYHAEYEQIEGSEHEKSGNTVIVI
jgi:hypothetical protein